MGLRVLLLLFFSLQDRQFGIGIEGIAFIYLSRCFFFFFILFLIFHDTCPAKLLLLIYC
jgi:hypothetical protein